MPRLPFEVPIESMRVGGLPADAGPPRPPTPEEMSEAIRDYAWDIKATRGRYEDGTPRVAAVDSGGVIHSPHIRKTVPCPSCEREYISAEYLAAHLKADHQSTDDESV